MWPFIDEKKVRSVFTILFQKKNSLKTDRTFFIEIIKNPSLNSGFILSISDYSASSAILSISAKLVVASSAVITNSSAIAASSSSDNLITTSSTIRFL